MDLTAIIDDYIANKREEARRELRYYAIQRSLRDAIRESALSRLPSKKRHPHQRRIQRKVLERAEIRLQSAADKTRKTKNFCELHDLIQREIRTIPGIGRLTVYDIAHRVGAYLKYQPRRVYLHAGTAIGAKAFGFSGRSINPDSLPRPFKPLIPAEIEDCLCIYKKRLRGK